MAWSVTRKQKSFWLCVAVAGLSLAAFVAGYSRLFGYGVVWENRAFGTDCTSGWIGAGVQRASSLSPTGLFWLPHHSGYNASTVLPRFFWEPGLKSVSMPLWIPFVLACVGAFLTYSRAPKPGACGKCEYNLAGNITGVCPECGTPA